MSTRRALVFSYIDRYAALAIAIALASHEFVIARHREREACFRAFLHNNWIGAVVFVGIAVDYALRA